MNLRRKLDKLRERTEARVATNPAEGDVRPALDVSPPAIRAKAASSGDSFSVEKADRIARLRTMIGRLSESASSRYEQQQAERTAPKWESLAGREIETEQGSFHLIEQLLDPGHCHGRVPVRTALEVDIEALAKLALEPRMKESALERLVIVDTETTGLAGGTGTIPFLVGLAWFEEGALQLEQLLLKNLSDETPILYRIAERLAWASLIVSYNGKSFDIPLLRTRFILNRVAMPELPPHLDLLHIARRVLKPRLDDLRLAQVERQVLGFYREGDVEGGEIPDIYLRFLRGADPAILAPIIEHNANDVIALAAILGKLTQNFESVHLADDPRDHLAYAKVASRAKDHERALTFARAAAQYSGSADVACDALILTARLARKNRDPLASVQALHQALEAASDPEAASQIHLSLAKLYEHALKDFPSARRHALNSAQAEGESRNLRRLKRIEKRMQEGKDRS
ncbi:MAG: ribonuclease H-like domain-containing protein [Deltaproteobacteria bacterium]|nr:ribonuclease H-like domain-containing protein [Deltaproteobacteria bacterium]